MAKEKKPVDKAKRNNIIYRVITILTLILPMPIYLIVSACILSITPDYILYEADTREWEVIEDSDYAFKISMTSIEGVTIDGEVSIEDGHLYIPFIPEVTIFEIRDGTMKSGYYQVSLDEADFTIATWENHTNSLFQKQLSYKLPIGIIFGILAMVIVALVVTKKMNILKKRPRLSVMLSLGMGTLVLLILELIVSSMLGVFITATAMWAAYCIEYMVYNRKTLFKSKEKKESEVISKLSEALKEIN